MFNFKSQISPKFSKNKHHKFFSQEKVKFRISQNFLYFFILEKIYQKFFLNFFLKFKFIYLKFLKFCFLEKFLFLNFFQNNELHWKKYLKIKYRNVLFKSQNQNFLNLFLKKYFFQKFFSHFQIKIFQFLFLNLFFVNFPLLKF